MKSALMRTGFVAIASFALSCTDPNVFETTQVADVYLHKGGYLVFSDQATFDAMRKEISIKSIEDLQNWERTFSGFTSMRAIIEKVENEEAIVRAGAINAVGHSAFYDQHRGAFVEDEDGVLAPNLPGSTWDLAVLVDERGLVKVGNSLLEYRENTLKEIVSGDESKLPLLKDVTISDPELGIKVSDVEVVTLRANDNGRTAFSNANVWCTGYSGGGGQRVNGDLKIIYYSQYDYMCWVSCLSWIYRHELFTVANNQMHQLGKWRNYQTYQLAIQGVVNVDQYTYNINFDTGGENYHTITLGIISTSWSLTPPSNMSINGNLTFSGRHGSTCGI
jgi:hypothetical protein